MKPNIADIDIVKKIEDFNGDIGAHKELIGKLMTRNEMLRRENLDLEMELQNYKWAHGELRKDKENQTKEIDAMQNVIKGQDEEIDRLREALVFYSMEGTYQRKQIDAVFFSPAAIEDDKGQRAREALRRDTHDPT